MTRDEALRWIAALCSTSSEWRGLPDELITNPLRERRALLNRVGRVRLRTQRPLMLESPLMLERER